MKIIESNNKILAVILTGGLSSRMGGGIKSFKKFNDKTIFDRISAVLGNQLPALWTVSDSLCAVRLWFQIGGFANVLNGHDKPTEMSDSGK